MKMRDSPLYRIRHADHYRTGTAWCLYPLYDFAHCLSDLIEGITHSICTLEFENNRELYDWIIEAVGVTDPASRPHQIEFARLNLTYTVMSKRKLLALVEGKHVAGWDDPRMPTLAGLRRRGVTPEAIRVLADRVGVAKNNSTVDLALFELVVREDLNLRAPRVLARAAAAQGGPRELARGRGRADRRALLARGRGQGRLARCRSPGCSTSSVTISWRALPRTGSASRPAARCACATPTSSPATTVVKDEATGEVVELRCSVRSRHAGRRAGGAAR